jgi:hypothetical protein
MQKENNMKRNVIISAISLVVIALFALIYVGYLQPTTIGENLIINPGMEEGGILPDSWAVSGIDEKHLISRDTEDFKSGIASAKMEVVGADRKWYNLKTQSPIKLIPGVQYTIEYSYKLNMNNNITGVSDNYAKSLGYADCYTHPEGCGERLAFEGNAYSDAEGVNRIKKLYFKSVGYSNNEEWTSKEWGKASGTFTVTQGSEYFSPVFYLYAINGTALIDDVVLKESKTCTSNWQCNFGQTCDGVCKKLNCGSGFKETLHECVIDTDSSLNALSIASQEISGSQN